MNFSSLSFLRNKLKPSLGSLGRSAIIISIVVGVGVGAGVGAGVWEFVLEIWVPPAPLPIDEGSLSSNFRIFCESG